MPMSGYNIFEIKCKRTIAVKVVSGVIVWIGIISVVAWVFYATDRDRERVQQHITSSEVQFQKEYQEQQAKERAEQEAFDRMSPLEKAKHLWNERGLSAANEAIAYLDQAPNSPEKQQLLADLMPYVNQYRAEQLDQAKQRIAAQAAEEADIKADADATWKQQYYATRFSVHHPSHAFIEKEPHDCDWDKAPIGNKECHFEKQVNVHKSSDGANDAVYVTWAKVSN